MRFISFADEQTAILKTFGRVRPGTDIHGKHLQAAMTKKLYGVVFGSAADEEYEGLAHVWVRDANTGYWFSMSRAVESDCIEVMVSDQLSCYDEVDVTLSKTGILVRLNDVGTQSLDGHREYAIEFHLESVDIAEIRETLEVIFRGKSGLLLHV